MDIKDYCDSTYVELTGMKARLYDVLRVIDQMPRETKPKSDPRPMNSISWWAI